jgi:Protein of unknown function (DUF3551)
MRLLLLALAVIVAGASTTARAQNYPWCAYYDNGSGSNCDFVSLPQCLADISGIGGFCQQNTLYQPPPGPHPDAARAAVTERAAGQVNSTTKPSRMVTRRSICAAMSILCVAMIAARPDARTS